MQQQEQKLEQKEQQLQQQQQQLKQQQEKIKNLESQLQIERDLRLQLQDVMTPAQCAAWKQAKEDEPMV